MSIGCWTQVAPQYSTETIMTMISYNGDLYAGTYPNGNLLKWDGVSTWLQMAPRQPGDSDVFDHIYKIVEFNGNLYAGMGSSAQLIQWNGVSAWTVLSSHVHGGSYINDLVILNGVIYAATNCDPNETLNLGELWQWGGSSFTVVAPQLLSQTAINNLVVYNNEIYGSTSPTGYLFKWNGIDAWTEVAIGPGAAVGRLIVYNNKIYGSYSGSPGKLLEWDGVGAWKVVSQVLPTGNFSYDIIEFNNDIYLGTGGSSGGGGGYLYKWDGSSHLLKVASPLNSQKYVYCLAVHNGLLYGGTGLGGCLFKYVPGTNEWIGMDF